MPSEGRVDLLSSRPALMLSRLYSRLFARFRKVFGDCILLARWPVWLSVLVLGMIF